MTAFVEPVVCCVMPTADRRALAPMALASFFGQTLGEAELIVIDDGADPIEDLIPSASQDSGCVRYVRMEGRRSTGWKRNLGAMLARAEIVCNWDDDDWSAPGRLAFQVERLRMTGAQVTGFYNTLYYNVDDAGFYLNEGAPVRGASGTSQMYHREWCRLNPFPDSSVGEDSEFSDAARVAGVLDSVDVGQLMVARAHAGSTCRLTFDRLPPVLDCDVPQGFRALLRISGVGGAV